jgi:hypothetical protein
VAAQLAASQEGLSSMKLISSPSHVSEVRVLYRRRDLLVYLPRLSLEN